MRRLLATALVAATLPGLAAAQDRPSLLDYFSLDVIVQRFLQSGIMMLRTQLDMKYSDMSVDMRTGGITLTDVVAWPLPEWDSEGTCEVRIGRVTLRSGALDQPDRIRLKAQLLNASFPASCLPAEPRGALGMAGLDAVTMPRMTLDIDYGIPASDATMRVYADIADVAVADLTSEFAYVWVDGRRDMEEPDPVIFLKSATLALENRGIWDALKGQLPPPFTGEGAGLVVEGAIGQALLDEARGENPTLSDSQRAFVSSVGQAWPAFLAAPETLVLETGIEGDVFLDFEAMEDELAVVFDTLRPRMALAPARQSGMLPVALLKQAMGADAAQLSAPDRKRLGIALVTGVGAPRNAEAGFALLNEMARGGDGEAATVMAQALEHRAPEDAYRWALLAGRAGETGATALLDRLERNLPFGRILELQSDVSGNDSHAGTVLAKVSTIRDEAAMRLSGRGQARSYEIAAMWAMIGAAAGDPEAADILGDIDERVRLAGPAAQGAWAAAEAKASGLATDAWVGQDLPARYGN